MPRGERLLAGTGRPEDRWLHRSGARVVEGQLLARRRTVAGRSLEDEGDAKVQRRPRLAVQLAL
jgi:hypothetical protein